MKLTTATNCMIIMRGYKQPNTNYSANLLALNLSKQQYIYMFNKKFFTNHKFSSMMKKI